MRRVIRKGEKIGIGGEKGIFRERAGRVRGGGRDKGRAEKWS